MFIVGNIPPETSAPRSRRENRAAILLAGRALFARHGLAGVTFEHIAREARLTRRTIYNHFANVDELFVAVIHQTLRQLKAQVPAAPPGEQQLHPALNRFMRDLLVLFTSTCFSDLHLALVRHGNDHPELRSAFEREILDPLGTSLATYLGTRRARDFHRDPQRGAEEMVAIMLGLAETSRLLGRTSDEAILHGLPLIAAIVQALASAQPNPLCRVA
ncbi:MULTISPECIES: TetR/AcrR family transcriptional regulator [unclassified Sphingomonas]|nr:MULTISPECIES: TetR/AcrR family transcriptional regulator [unclassified Sphingomonas]